MSNLYYQDAAHIAAQIASRDISCEEVMNIFLARIEEINPKLNAICTLLPEQAMAEAKAKDTALADGTKPGPLYGLPIAIKDMAETKGIRTTYGSPLHNDNIPDFDQLFVTRIKQAGAIIIGKTNTPEFGAGSHTFNRVFGMTRNPYNPDRSAGGSSGGAASALASGMLPIADGSDLGGSLRNPASFCNVVGFRPTPGRVARFPAPTLREDLSTNGPMARTVTDTALLFSAIAGPDGRDPLCLETPGSDFAGGLDRDFKDSRIAYSSDLGMLAIDPAVRAIIKTAVPIFEGLGATVTEDHPDLLDAEDIFLRLRSNLFAARHAANYEKNKSELKDTIIWNYEQGLGVTLAELAAAKKAHAALYQRGVAFFEKYDFLIMPTVQLPPFPVETEWPDEIDGVKYTNYLQWMQSCCAISLLGAPAISVPAGFTEDGLPVGLQIVGKPRDDMGVLQIAYAFEQATRVGERRPQL